MARIIKNLLSISVVAMVVPMMAFGAQKENPRGTAVVRGDSEYTQGTDNNDLTRRSATSVITRNVSAGGRQSRVAGTNSGTSQGVKSRSGKNVVVNTLDTTRSAVKSSVVRSGATQKKQNSVNVSRATRKTPVFNDISKIGNGYMSCRDAYATCMDQFCADTNPSYGRCFCSDKFLDYRETSEKLDSAVSMLAKFNDSNLDAVDKTAAEVKAMYTASAGEKAIKKDTSASQKLLNSIGDILSGKTTVKKNSLNSLGVLDFSGFNDDGDLWGDDDSFSLFGGDSSNVADLEGKALYNRAHKQCSEIIRESCSSDAIYSLARSSYSLMISQECSVVEQKLNAKRASLEDTVRTAEKYLREARLEEYRAHNSADVLECLEKVDTAMRNPLACGPKYENCLDYTGRYIEASTGNPIYSNALFGLNNLIVLDGTADVLKANPGFDKWLESRKQFAETALDSCRDISGNVWQEYKRSALIQIAQAQDNKIQEIKDSCVETIKECYDEKSDALYDMAITDYTETEYTRGIAAVAARGACYDRVLACAALYGDPNGCKYDDKTKKITNAGGNKKCGLQSLLVYVDTVDSVKVAEGCELALSGYAHQLCDPQVGDPSTYVYPMGCATMTRASLRAKMETYRKTFCPSTLVEDDNSNTLLTASEVDAFNTNIMNQIIIDIYDELGIIYTGLCQNLGGTWTSADGGVPNISAINQAFYQTYYDTTVTANNINSLNLPDVGYCIISDEEHECTAQGFTWNAQNGCQPTAQWYATTCQDLLGGTWNSSSMTCSVTIP